MDGSYCKILFSSQNAGNFIYIFGMAKASVDFMAYYEYHLYIESRVFLLIIYIVSFIILMNCGVYSCSHKIDLESAPAVIYLFQFSLVLCLSSS